MPQLSHRAVVQVSGVLSATSDHLLLSLSTEMVKPIRMRSDLNLSRFMAKDLMGVVISPCQKFSSSTLTPFEHIA